MRMLTGTCIASWMLVCCVLPENGGNSATGEGAISRASGGASSWATGGTAVVYSGLGGGPAPGGAAAIGGATISGSDGGIGLAGSTGDASGGSSSCVVDASSNDLCGCRVTGTTTLPANTIIRGGSVEVPALDANPSNWCAAPSAFLLPVSPETIVGYPYWTFDEGDIIYSIGALTSLYNITFAGNFWMAIYSDAQGVPDANIYTSGMLTATDTTNGSLPPEELLPCPIRITKTGRYWVTMLTSANKDNIKLYMNNQNVDQSIFFASGGITPLTLQSEWTPKLQQWTSCSTILGNYPHFFVRLLPPS